MERTKTAPWRALTAVLSSLALAAALVPAAAIGPVQVAWADDATYTWADSSGSAQTDGISTSTTTSEDDDGNTVTQTTVTLSGTGTFALTADTTADLVVTGTVTLDLAGHTLTGTGTTSVVTVTGGTLAITDSSAKAAAEVTDTSSLPSGVYSDDTFTAGVVSNSDGTVTTYWQQDSSDEYGNVQTAIMSYTSGAITGGVGTAAKTNYAYGGGVYMTSGTLTLEGGAIAGNSASVNTGYEYGGGVYLGGGTFEMTGGAVAGNAASTGLYMAYGGGVFASAATVKVSGGCVVANTAKQGGGIYAEGTYNSSTRSCSAVLEISGGAISSNTATSGYGGGIRSEYTDVSMTAGNVSHNTANTMGGGICLMSGYSLTLSGGLISNNESQTSYGGGFYAGGTWYAGTAYLSGVVIAQNTAYNGGGIALTGTSIEMTGGSVYGNRASGSKSYISGGGVYVYGGGTFTAKGGIIAANSASKYADDVYKVSNGTVNIYEGVNSAGYLDENGVSYRFLYWGKDGTESSTTRWSSGGTTYTTTTTDSSGDSYLSFASGTAYGLKAVFEEGGVTFLGGSLRYSVSDEETSAAYYSSDAGSTSLRLGFTYQLPVDSSGNLQVGDGGVTIYYAVGTTQSAVAAYSGYTDTSSGTVYSGTAKREYGTQSDSDGYATYLSNVVVTGIGASHYADEVYARVWVVYTESSTGEGVVLASNTVHRSVGDVCEGIAKSYDARVAALEADSSADVSGYATAAEKAYATALCAAYYDKKNEALYDGAPTSTDES